MMDPSNVASVSLASNAPNPPLPGSILPSLPLVGAVTPSFNSAIALQQYEFQQSLMNQQLVAQQQAAKHAVSFKAAAERAAARAAEISILLNDETKAVQISEDLIAERDKSGLKSPSGSALPPQSSKPNTISPVRCRNSHREPEEHSPRDLTGYGSRRNSSSYRRDNDLRGYSRSSYRREENYSGSRNSYSKSSNTSRSRRRSPSSRPRYRHGDSRSPQHHVSSRSPRRHLGSNSPRRHRKRSPSPISRQQKSSRASNRHSISKDPIKGGSSSTSPLHTGKASPRKSTARRSLSASDDSPIQNNANLLLKETKDAGAINTSENNISSNLNARGRDRDAEPALKKTVSRDFASARMDCSDSNNSQGRSVRRGLGSGDCKNDSETSVPPRVTDQANLPTAMLERFSDRSDGDTENRNGDFSMSNGKGTQSDHCQRNYSDKREENMHAHKEFDIHKQVLSRKVISSKEEGSANIPGECAIYPLPEGHESMYMKVDFASPVMVPDMDPKISKHREKRHKRRSISRDRKMEHRKSHHKKHQDESEGEITDVIESHERRKMNSHEKKGRYGYH